MFNQQSSFEHEPSKIESVANQVNHESLFCYYNQEQKAYDENPFFKDRYSGASFGRESASTLFPEPAF